MTARAAATPCRECGADVASTCWGCINRALATDALRPRLVERLAAAGFGPAGIEGATASWRAQCPSCRAAGARRLSASVRVTATPAGLLVSCTRGCPSPTIMRALDALDGWGVAP